MQELGVRGVPSTCMPPPSPQTRHGRPEKTLLCATCPPATTCKALIIRHSDTVTGPGCPHPKKNNKTRREMLTSGCSCNNSRKLPSRLTISALGREQNVFPEFDVSVKDAAPLSAHTSRRKASIDLMLLLFLGVVSGEFYEERDFGCVNGDGGRMRSWRASSARVEQR